MISLILTLTICLCFSIGNFPMITSVLKAKSHDEVKVLNLWTYTSVMIGTIVLLVQLVIVGAGLFPIISQSVIALIYAILYGSIVYQKVKFR